MLSKEDWLVMSYSKSKAEREEKDHRGVGGGTGVWPEGQEALEGTCGTYPGHLDSKRG